MRRALLYIPASSQKMLDKSLELKVDCAVYDLEDSVAEDQKNDARERLLRFLNQDRPQNVKEIAVRINAIDTKHALKDLQSILSAKNLNTILIPKTETAGDIEFVTNVLRQVLPERHPVDGDISHNPVKLLPLIESAKGLLNLQAICTSSPYIDGLVFAAEDFTLDLGITRTDNFPELLYARSQIVTVARAFRLESVIDMVCTSYKDTEGQETLHRETIAGKNLGFNGKQCIHPAQVEQVQNTYSPDQKQLEWAIRVTIANEKAKKAGKGAWSLDGKMIDAPVVKTAGGIVERAKACDIDISELQTKFANQEPE